MRTEEFLRGYNDCRGSVRNILTIFPKLQKNNLLMKLAQYPYYKEDGKDWHPDCNNCKYWDLDMDFEYCCIKGVKIEEIGEKCLEKELVEK